MDIYRYKKYLTTKEKLKETLELYGVAIIPNVINEKECNDMINNMWDYLEHITKNLDIPINRNDYNSWGSYSKLYFLHSMLIKNFGIGHSKLLWDLRQNSKIIDIFAKLWNVKTEDLLVSFDGASFHFPPEKTKKGWNRGGIWLHTDQSYLRNEFECIQSWITAYDVNPGDATLTFLEKSHLYHAKCAEKFNITDKPNWYKLTDEHIDYYTSKGCNKRSIKCKKGDLVLWDSRTIHQGQEPLKERLEENFRCVAYLCYTPRSLASKTDLKKKVKCFEDLRTTSHWPHKPKMNPINPRTYGQELPNINPIAKPILTDVGRRLAGY